MPRRKEISRLRSGSKGLALLLALLVLPALEGCFWPGRDLETHYYMLEYRPTPPRERVEKGPYPYVVRIRDFTISEAYRRSNIVYRQSAHQMGFYNYHLWSVDPDRMVYDMAVRHLREARLFQNIMRTVENFVPDFHLSAEVQAVEEYDARDQWFAHLAVEYKLENARTSEVVFQKVYDLRKPVAQMEPVFVVRELSSLLETINDRLIADLEVVLDEHHTREIQQRDSLRQAEPQRAVVPGSLPFATEGSDLPARPAR